MKKILLLLVYAVQSAQLCAMESGKDPILSAQAVDLTHRLFLSAVGGSVFLSQSGKAYAQRAVELLTVPYRRTALVSPDGKWILVGLTSKTYNGDQFLLCDTASKKSYEIDLKNLPRCSYRCHQDWKFFYELIGRSDHDDDELYSTAFLDADTLLFSDTARIYAVSCSDYIKTRKLDAQTIIHDADNGIACYARTTGGALYISSGQKILYKQLKQGVLSLIAKKDGQWVRTRIVRFKRPVALHEHAGAEKGSYVAVHISTKAIDQRIAHGVALIDCEKKASKMVWPELGRWGSKFSIALAPKGNFLVVSDGASIAIYEIGLAASVEAIAAISLGTMLNKVLPRWNSHGLFYNGDFLTTYKVFGKSAASKDLTNALNNGDDNGKELVED